MARITVPISGKNPIPILTKSDGLRNVTVVNQSAGNVYVETNTDKANANDGYPIPALAEKKFEPWKGDMFASADNDNSQILVLISDELKP